MVLEKPSIKQRIRLNIPAQIQNAFHFPYPLLPPLNPPLERRLAFDLPDHAPVLLLAELLDLLRADWLPRNPPLRVDAAFRAAIVRFDFIC